MTLKVDIQKTFDTISWAFLIEVLYCIEFNGRFLDWVCYFYSHSGSLFYFMGFCMTYSSAQMDAIQGNPLFCFDDEFLSRVLLRLVTYEFLAPLYSSKEIPFVSFVVYR